MLDYAPSNEGVWASAGGVRGHLSLISPLDGSDRTTSSPDWSTTSPHQQKESQLPEAEMDVLDKNKVFCPLPGIEFRIVQFVALLIYRLSYLRVL